MKTQRISFARVAVLLAAGLDLAACGGAMRTGKKGAGGASDAGLGGSGGLGSVAAGGSGGLAVGGAGGMTVVGGAGGTTGLVDGGAGGMGGTGNGGGGGLAVGGQGGIPRAGGQSGTSTAVGGGGTRAGGGGGQSAGGAMAGAGGSPLGVGGSGGFGVGGEPGYGSLGDRPSDWTPPFVAPVGTPGWQQSTSPICDRNLQGLDEGFDVWADERGVFALIADSHSGGMSAGIAHNATLQFNSGTGWQPFYEFPANAGSGASLLGGFRGGSLLVAEFIDGGYGLSFLDEDGLAMQTPLGYPFGAFVASKDAAGSDLAYVASRQVLKYSAGMWSTVDQGNEVYSVWTDGQTVVAVGWDQTVLMGPADGPLTPVKGVPAGDYLAVWGFGSKDLWFGNSGPLLVHFDGSKWELHETGSLSYGGIRQLWGDAGILYFATATEFGRWNGSTAEILLKPPAGTDSNLSKGKLGRFWGRSAKEVFIPLRDSRYKDYTCGTAFMLWYDGAQFHSF